MANQVGTALVIEVADTSVGYDRDVKVPLYSRAGIPEVWLVDLSTERIEVFRDLAAAQYTSVRSASRGGVLTPLRLPEATAAVDEILAPAAITMTAGGEAYRTAVVRLATRWPARLMARTILRTVATVGFPRPFSSRDRVSARIPARRATSPCVSPAWRRRLRSLFAIETVA